MFLFCLVFAMSLCVSVYMCFVVTCWERADLLALVCGVCCEFVTFQLVSWVRCGTWLYRFLIFAPLLTFILQPGVYKVHLQIILASEGQAVYRERIHPSISLLFPLSIGCACNTCSSFIFRQVFIFGTMIAYGVQITTKGTGFSARPPPVPCVHRRPANNKGTGQAAHPCSLILVVVIRSMQSIYYPNLLHTTFLGRPIPNCTSVQSDRRRC